MLKPENLQFLGLLGVDSGMVAISDPCHSSMIAEAMERDPGGIADHDFEFATVVPTLRGDGLFEVFGVHDDEGNVTGIYIDFTGQFGDVDVIDDAPAPTAVAV